MQALLCHFSQGISGETEWISKQRLGEVPLPRFCGHLKHHRKQGALNNKFVNNDPKSMINNVMMSKDLKRMAFTDI